MSRAGLLLVGALTVLLGCGTESSGPPSGAGPDFSVLPVDGGGLDGMGSGDSHRVDDGHPPPPSIPAGAPTATPMSAAGILESQSYRLHLFVGPTVPVAHIKSSSYRLRLGAGPAARPIDGEEP